jgi:hypothetical protein
MSVFQAFFDAGGDPNDARIRVLSMAGWVAPENRWRQLERAWIQVCKREGVNGLHMREFAHSTGEYAHWKGDEQRRARFLGDLAKVIHTYTNRDFSQTFFLDGYRAVDAQFEFHERVGHPYALCALRCISQVRDWMNKHPHDDIMFVFEKGDAHQAELIDLLKRDEVDLWIDPLFMEKRWTTAAGEIKTVPALECADFSAYEHHKTITDLRLKGKLKGRTSM